MADNLTLIRRKNAAFARLSEAMLACERRRHTAGAVPPEWALRLSELQADYGRAVTACEVLRESET